MNTQSIIVSVPLRIDGQYEETELLYAELDAVATSFPITIDPPRTNLSIIDINGILYYLILQYLLLILACMAPSFSRGKDWLPD